MVIRPHPLQDLGIDKVIKDFEKSDRQVLTRLQTVNLTLIQTLTGEVYNTYSHLVNATGNVAVFLSALYPLVLFLFYSQSNLVLIHCHNQFAEVPTNQELCK